MAETAFWTRTRVFLVAIVLAFAVASVGSISWGALLVANRRTTPSVPWSVPAMALVLAALLAYASGRGPPRQTSRRRHDLLRPLPVTATVSLWSLAAGMTSVAALAGLWILMVRLGMPGGNPTETFAGLPPYAVAFVIAMASLVSPLTEEAAFRGYAQTLLERAFSPPAAIAISSSLFALWHGPTQGFHPAKLAFFFLVGASFGTIARLTRSTLPALPSHIGGDLLFFIVIWPADASRRPVATTGLDGAFWLVLGGTIVLAWLSILAFMRLRRLPRSARSTATDEPA